MPRPAEPPGESALDVLRRRYASGEIDHAEYEQKRGDIAAPVRRARWWRHSLWIALTFTLGLLNWLAFLYIGLRARRIVWLVSGFIYLIPPTLTVVFYRTPLFRPIIAMQLATSVVSIAQALIARPRYRAIMLSAAATPPGWTRAIKPMVLPKGFDEGAAEVIREAEKTIEDIGAAASTVEDAAVRDKVAALCTTAVRILAALRDEPKRVGQARTFLVYYLEAAHKIVLGYVDLRSRDLRSPAVQQTLERALASLDNVQRAFERELVNLVQTEVIDLDSEVDLLEKTVKMESLASYPAP